MHPVHTAVFATSDTVTLPALAIAAIGGIIIGFIVNRYVTFPDVRNLTVWHYAIPLAIGTVLTILFTPALVLAFGVPYVAMSFVVKPRHPDSGSASPQL